MLALFWRTIKDRKITIIVYSVTAILFLWMYIALFPTISESFDQLKTYIESFPQGIMEAFGVDAETFVTFEGYIGSEQFSFVWPIMIIALMISFSGWSIAGEVEKSTIEILLSQPISRLKIFFSKYLAGLSILIFFIIASVATIFPMASAYDISIKSENFLKVGVLGLLFGMAVYSISIIFSVIFSEKSRANFIPAGILVVMYVIHIVSALKESLENLKYTSFFYYFSPSKALVHNEIEPLAWWVFIGTFIVATTIAAIWFKKRDIAV